jgi:arylsulfatase A-like enzyme
MDAQIGRVLQALERRGLHDSTLVVFSADNGLAIGSHGLFGKQNLYEHSIHQPLIFSGPGIRKGKQSEVFCYLFDVFPTLGDLCSVTGPAGSEGMSLAPILRGKPARGREVVFTAYRQYQRALREGDWKLITYPQINRTQLFNLRRDPHEIRNLATDPDYANEVVRLTERLRQAQVTFGDHQPLTSERPAPAEFDWLAAERNRTPGRN